MGKGSGAGGGKGKGHGKGQGHDAVDGMFAGGAAAAIFFIFMWVIGLPILLSGIGLVTTQDG